MLCGAALNPSAYEPPLTHNLGAALAPTDAIASVEADIFAPCALGGVLDDRSVQELKAQVVVGAANNQLLEPRHGDALAARGVLYIPDFVANAGGVLSGGADFFGWPRSELERRVHAIYDTVLQVLAAAAADASPPHLAAERLAEQRLRLQQGSPSGAPRPAW
jgi:leucine dehydrogenase